MPDGVTQGPLLPDKMDLPSGGWVTFRDLDLLTGKDLKEYRRQVYNNHQRGDGMNATGQVLMQLLVTGWYLPLLPNLPLPSEDPTVGDLLNWRDLAAIEDALSVAIPLLIGRGPVRTGTSDLTPGGPTPPGSV